jgi:diguanylate cyclase (GGDEF)-like protein
MESPVTRLRRLPNQLAPGSVLLLAAWAVQREEVVRTAAAPYAVYFCAGALVAAVLLSWYYDQSQLFCSAAVIALTVLASEPSALDTQTKSLATFLLPLNLSLFAVLKERGVMTVNGLFKTGIVCAQAVGVPWSAGGTGLSESGLWWRDAITAKMGLPWMARLSFAIGAVTLLTLFVRRRTKVEQGLLWALAAMFVGLNQLDLTRPDTDALFLYSGAAGLMLVFAVLEHGYDIAYRDELTGLPGRRAFNNVMEQLGGTYAIAMCDVDHFKRFNDTYGHDAGDEVLRKVASKLSQVGGGGRAFRYGGEEFLIVFRGRSATEAERFLESLRCAIADEGFVLRAADRPARTRAARGAGPGRDAKVNITISIGLAERSKRHSTPDLVLDAADAALYRAKEAGRNCLTFAESTQT